jgi:hypothetical protein
LVGLRFGGGLGFGAGGGRHDFLSRGCCGGWTHNFPCK